MSFDLTQKIKVVNPTSNIDELYGPYTSVANALAGVPVVLRQLGRTVGIIEGGTIQEYWFKNGTTDSDLVLKGGGEAIDQENVNIVHTFTLDDIGADGTEDETTLNQLITDYINSQNIVIGETENHYFILVDGNDGGGGVAGETEIPDWQEQSYQQGNIVAHNGGIWRSEVDGNETEPIVTEGESGDSSWEEIPPFSVKAAIFPGDVPFTFNFNDKKLFEGADIHTYSYSSASVDALGLTFNAGDIIFFLDDGPAICEVSTDILPSDTAYIISNKLTPLYLTYPIPNWHSLLPCEDLFTEPYPVIDSNETSVFKLISCPYTDFPEPAQNSWTLLAELNDNSGIKSIQEGDNISIDNTDPQNPIISAIGGGGSSTSPLTEILYADLKTLRDNGELIPGMQYRITDYVTTTTQPDTQSAGHQFDVIVTADSASVLNEDARAALHNGDTYFADAKLESWKLKYCIDNDTSRFLWAGATNGKGVIHHMIDDKGNSLFYDFKNIQFKRYKITAVSNSGLESVYLNTYMGLPNYNLFTIDEGDFIWLYTFNTVYSSSTKDDSLSDIYCRGNVIDEMFFNSSILELNNNTFGNNIYNNTFGGNCHHNTFGNNYQHNTFGNSVYYNTFGNTVHYNTFGNNCSYNTFGNSVYRNTAGNELSNNTFGNNVYYNTFGNGVYYNTFGMGSTGKFFRYNHIENGCTGIVATKKDWTSQTALYGNNKFYSVQIFGHRTSESVPTTNTWQYYNATGTLVKGTW